VRILRRALDTLLAHARRGYPFEACGVLIGRRAPARRVTRAVAVHNCERDTPRVRYAIAPEDLLRLQREALAEGLEVVGFYHSHPDHPARPSETDRRLATDGLSDGIVHVVVGVAGGMVATPAAWVFAEAAAGFTEEAIEVEDDG
jgi:proteasome lid subunit RPN8/RPN11